MRSALRLALVLMMLPLLLAFPAMASQVHVRAILDYEVGVALVRIEGFFERVALPENASAVRVLGTREWKVEGREVEVESHGESVTVEYAVRCTGNVSIPLPEGASDVDVLVVSKGLPWGSEVFINLIRDGRVVASSLAIPVNGTAQVALSFTAPAEMIITGYRALNRFTVRVTSFKVCCPSAGRIRCTVGLEVPEGVEVVFPKDLVPEGYTLIVNVTLRGKPKGLATKEYVEQYLVPVEKPGRYVAVLEINGTKVRVSSVDVPLLSSGEGTRIMLAASLLGVAVVLVAAAYWRMRKP